MSGVPGSDPLPATIRRELDALWAAVRALEAPVRPSDDIVYHEQELTFSIADRPVLDAESPPYHVRVPRGYLTEARLSFATASSGGDTTIAILVNGNEETSFTHNSSSEDPHHELEDDFNIKVDEWDRVQVKCTALDDDAAGVTVQIIMKVPELGL